MPLYEYRCASCSRTVEVIQKFSDKPLKKCEECGGKLEKLISASGFVLKGGGWYANAYQKPAGVKDGDQKSADKDGDAKKADRKPKDDAAAKGPEPKKPSREGGTDKAPAAPAEKLTGTTKR